MKKLILMSLFMGLLTSCITPEYTAKDRDGAPILIKDSNGVIDDALALNLDSIYVVRYNRDDYFTPLRRMAEEETTFWSDSINSKKHHFSASYRIVHLSNIIKR